MSEENTNELPDPVAEVVGDIADSIVKDAIEDAVQDKLEELAKSMTESKVVEEAPKPAENVITGKTAPKAEPVETTQALAPVADGVIGATKVAKPKPAAKKAAAPAVAEEETVAVHSTRNVVWSGVGKVIRGYNIVSKSASLKWLERDHIRLSTPEEVAKEYNK